MWMLLIFPEIILTFQCPVLNYFLFFFLLFKETKKCTDLLSNYRQLYSSIKEINYFPISQAYSLHHVVEICLKIALLPGKKELDWLKGNDAI